MWGCRDRNCIYSRCLYPSVCLEPSSSFGQSHNFIDSVGRGLEALQLPGTFSIPHLLSPPLIRSSPVVNTRVNMMRCFIPHTLTHHHPPHPGPGDSRPCEQARQGAAVHQTAPKRAPAPCGGDDSDSPIACFGVCPFPAIYDPPSCLYPSPCPPPPSLCGCTGHGPVFCPRVPRDGL